jgi:hypothetical protein
MEIREMTNVESLAISTGGRDGTEKNELEVRNIRKVLTSLRIIQNQTRVAAFRECRSKSIHRRVQAMCRSGITRQVTWTDLTDRFGSHRSLTIGHCLKKFPSSDGALNWCYRFERGWVNRENRALIICWFDKRSKLLELIILESTERSGFRSFPIQIMLKTTVILTIVKFIVSVIYVSTSELRLNNGPSYSNSHSFQAPAWPRGTRCEFRSSSNWGRRSTGLRKSTDFGSGGRNGVWDVCVRKIGRIHGVCRSAG